MNRKKPELKKIICTQENPDYREFGYGLKCSLLMALVELEILDDADFEQAEALLGPGAP